MSTDITIQWELVKQACAQLPLSTWRDREALSVAVRTVESALSTLPREQTDGTPSTTPPLVKQP